MSHSPSKYVLIFVDFSAQLNPFRRQLENNITPFNHRIISPIVGTFPPSTLTIAIWHHVHKKSNGISDPLTQGASDG